MSNASTFKVAFSLLSKVRSEMTQEWWSLLLYWQCVQANPVSSVQYETEFKNNITGNNTQEIHKMISSGDQIHISDTFWKRYTLKINASLDTFELDDNRAKGSDEDAEEGEKERKTKYIHCRFLLFQLIFQIFRLKYSSTL